MKFMLNEYSERYLIGFVRDLISDTKQGDLEWNVDYDFKNNRHLKICTSDDKQIKITGIYDKNTLEKVSFLITKSVTVNSKNQNLLNKFEELITLVDGKQELKLDLPYEITDYIRSYYEKTSRLGSYIKPNKSQSVKPGNSNKKDSGKQNNVPTVSSTENTSQEFEIVEESGIEMKVKKKENN